MAITPLMPVYPRCEFRPVRGDGAYLFGEDGRLRRLLEFEAPDPEPLETRVETRDQGERRLERAPRHPAGALGVMVLGGSRLLLTHRPRQPVHFAFICMPKQIKPEQTLIQPGRQTAMRKLSNFSLAQARADLPASRPQMDLRADHCLR